MARAVSVGFDELNRMLTGLSVKCTIAAKKAINAAAPALESATRANVAAASATYGTGRLAASFSATPAKENALGVYSVVRPVGARDGYDYADRAAWLEYGVYHRNEHWKSAPHPWRSASVEAARGLCEQTIEEVMA